MSAFQGYLVKCGDTVFPHTYIKMSTYKCTPQQRTDKDSGHDANNILRRTVLNKTHTKIEFETPSLHLTDKEKIQKIINDAMTNKKERKLPITYWDDESNSYRTITCYMPDTEYTIKRISDNDIVYESIRICFIEY